MQESGDFRRINGNALKIIACISMLIDHAAAGIIVPIARDGLLPDGIDFGTVEFVYKILRGVGRTAFPIFCFLLVEGFVHTKSRLRYSLSLLIFGLISEPFFDVTFYCRNDIYNINILQVLRENRSILADHSNVYFTLFIGLLVMWAIQSSFTLVEKLQSNNIFAYLLSGMATFLGAFIAQKIESDYHWFGVVLIAIFYIFRFFEPINLVAGYLFLASFSTEYLAFPAFILIYFYNKKRGRRLGKLKYAFYAFYPVHILLIYVARCLIYG
ncbi:TraX family protein [Butyrivibrio sp. AE2032]|uniref:TraX family protein n=1 Tax=Butyrivibrio sp. AE2032 TaxID=1458463 RepID=UPI0005555F8D|nr:TraX family protein [Butyrivibrio sp. AE2032]